MSLIELLSLNMEGHVSCFHAYMVYMTYGKLWKCTCNIQHACLANAHRHRVYEVVFKSCHSHEFNLPTCIGKQHIQMYITKDIYVLHLFPVCKDDIFIL